jgi:hypothetical protein
MSSIFSRNFENKKKDQKILILGPYKPPLAEKRLMKLRDCLRSHGYDNAKTVKDFPDIPKYDEDPDKHFTLKSEDKIKNWGDALIFVFMCNANNLGVWAELQSTLFSVKEKIHNTVELHEKGIDLSTQTRGRVKISRLYSYEFGSDQQLCDQVVAFCTNIVYEAL